MLVPDTMILSADWCSTSTDGWAPFTRKRDAVLSPISFIKPWSPPQHKDTSESRQEWAGEEVRVGALNVGLNGLAASCDGVA